jgi:TatD DNase family protein
MLVDSHCHLDFPDFAEDLDAVVARARGGGVGAMLSIGTRLSRIEGVLAICERYAGVFCSLGIHPHEAAHEPEATAEHLVRMAARCDKAIAFGETGLDLHYRHSPLEAQERSFRTHIAAARKIGLPVIVHTRDADAETLQVLRDEMARGPFGGVIHCFSSSRALAEGALDLGLYLSVAGVVTFRKADELRAIMRDIPLDRLLVETDAPYLAPVPRRGKRNEPAFVVHTAACVAEVKGMPAEAVHRATTDNFFRLFAKAPRPAETAALGAGS